MCNMTFTFCHKILHEGYFGTLHSCAKIVAPQNYIQGVPHLCNVHQPGSNLHDFSPLKDVSEGIGIC